MLIDDIRKKAGEIIHDNDIYIKGIWSVDCMFNPNAHERVFDYKFLVVKSIGQGSAYSMNKNYDPVYLKTHMGRNLRDVAFSDLAFEIAVYDSIFDKYQDPNFDREYIIDGSSTDKAVKRAGIVSDECKRLLSGKNNAKVVNVGVVSNVIKALRDEGYEVAGTDYDDEIVGSRIYKDVMVYSGDNTIELVRDCDLAVITGMTLTTSSADDILKAARDNDTKIVVFAETASHMGDFFLEHGAHAFVSEPYPFYIFDGCTKIKVKRKKNG